MCMVSAVTGWGQTSFPNPLDFPHPLYPNYRELVEKARKYDELMKQQDCPNPEKDAWQKQLEQIMEEKYGLKPTTGTPQTNSSPQT
jgi:hypothetical protein